MPLPKDFELHRTQAFDHFYARGDRTLFRTFSVVAELLEHYVNYLDEGDAPKAKTYHNSMLQTRRILKRLLPAKRSDRNSLVRVEGIIRQFGRTVRRDTKKYSRMSEFRHVAQGNRAAIADLSCVAVVYEEAAVRIRSFYEALDELVGEVRRFVQNHSTRQCRGLSAAARIELRGVGHRIDEMFRMAKLILDEREVSISCLESFFGNLVLFVAQSEARHQERLAMGECTFRHNLTYRRLMSSARGLARRILEATRMCREL